MKRSPSYNDLGESNGVGVERGVHSDLHFDAGLASNASRPWAPPPSQTGYQGQQWQGPVPQQSRPIAPQIPPSQWNVPVQTPTSNTRYDNANEWDDFLDMPEPTATPHIPVAQQLPPRHDTQSTYWNTPSTQSPFENLPSSLSASLPQYASPPPPPIPPKTPIGYAPPLPPRDHHPASLTPHSPSPRPHDEGTYLANPATPSPTIRPSTGTRLTPEGYQYNALPPRPSSHSGMGDDVPFFVPPSQRPPQATTPPRPERYSPQPSPPQQPPFHQHHQQQYTPSPPHQQQPFQQQYKHPPPQPHYQQPHEQSYQKPLPVEPYRRPSPPRQQHHQQPPPARPSPPRQSPPRPSWRPSPPTHTRPPAGPITSIPPANSLTSIRHLPYPPILLPPYHKETSDHPQHFAKSSLLKIIVTPAENTTFLAGSEIFGRMEVFCKGDGGGSKGKSELLLGELGIELMAYDGPPPTTPPYNLSAEQKLTR